jgi:hypothetical protein
VKTQIIQLSQKEDPISVKDKMSWCQIGRILLIWPPQGRVLDRQLDLILIKRYADSMGAELAFVTTDSEVRDIAGKIGVQVFDTPRQAQERDWKTGRQNQIEHRPEFFRPNLEQLGASIKHNPPGWISHPIIKYTCLGISLLAIVALAIFILPSARVTLAPHLTTQSMQLDLFADPAATAVNLSSGSLPTYNREVIVEASEVISSTGSLAVPHEAARASLVFTNKSHQALTIPIGTVVTTTGSDPVRFVTDAMEVVTLKPNKSTTIEAHAIKPGSRGNLPAGSLVAVEGNLGMELAVTNPDVTAGGTDVQINAPQARDLQALREQLSANLMKDALLKLQSSLPDGDILVLPSIKILEVMEETSQPAIGEPGDQLAMSRRLRVQANVVSNETLRELVTPILDASQLSGSSAVPGSLKITPLSAQEMNEDGRTHWKVQVTRSLTAEIPTGQMADSIRGATVQQAAERISMDVPLEEAAKIILTPGWWPRLPFLAMRITFAQAEPQ